MKIKRQNLVDSVTRELQKMIRNGEFRPGQRMPSQEGLAVQFGVGRSTIREAIQALRLVGIMEILPGRGTYVCQDSMEVFDLGKIAALRLKELGAAELYEARFVLERALAAFAAERASSNQVARIKKAFEGMRQNVGNNGEFARHDLDFHLAVAEGAGNRLLEQLYYVSRELLRETLEYVAAIPGVKENAIRLHSDIVQEIERGDSDGAAASVDAWKRYVEQVLISYGIYGNNE